jgi:hydroxyethylthiazole kinase-like uncharacterized protein yjeF
MSRPRPRQSRVKPSVSDRVAAPLPREVYVLTREAAREVDRIAAGEYGMPTIVLMENAARRVAEIALAMVDVPTPRVLIFCGTGNNGGDGLAAARHLHNAGARVRVEMVGSSERCGGDARVNLEIARRMTLEMREFDAAGRDDAEVPDLVIDALLGTGTDRPLNDVFAAAVARINALVDGGAAVLAVDLPSGLDARSGAVLGVAVRADVTVTFAGIKPGLLALEAQQFVGEVIVADIGVPVEVIRRLGKPMPPPEAERASSGEDPDPPSAHRRSEQT